MDLGGELLKPVPARGSGAVLGSATPLPARTLLRPPRPDSSPAAQTPAPKTLGLSGRSPGCSRWPRSRPSHPAAPLAAPRQGPQPSLALRPEAAWPCCRARLDGRHAETGQDRADADATSAPPREPAQNQPELLQLGRKTCTRIKKFKKTTTMSSLQTSPTRSRGEEAWAALARRSSEEAIAEYGERGLRSSAHTKPAAPYKTQKRLPEELHDSKKPWKRTAYFLPLLFLPCFPFSTAQQRVCAGQAFPPPFHPTFKQSKHRRYCITSNI